MTEIKIIRHGQTAWNTGEIYRGRTDIELDETGLKQAELLSDHLKNTPIEAIFSSPLKRALATAGAIARHHDNAQLETRQDIIDFNYGDWQKLTRSDVMGKYPEVYRKWVTSPHTVKIPGGESLDGVRSRVLNIVKEIIENYRGSVLVVAHRVVNKVLICALLGLDNAHFWNIRQDTCGITTFHFEEEQFILTEHNNTCFLKPIQAGDPLDF